MSDDTVAVDDTETVSAPNPQWNPADMLAQFDISKMIADQVAAELAKANAQSPNPIVHAEQRGRSQPEPESYLKHYRCDVSPDLTIVRRNADGDKLGSPIKGQYIKFRRGHYFATDQDVVDQIEWLMRNPTTSPSNPEQVIGGVPTIYEDDGRDLIRCEYCPEPFVRGSNAYKAHLRATHGVT